MSNHKFELSDEAITALGDAYGILNGELEVHRDAFCEMSERWQEGDKGQAVDTWIETLDELAATLDDYERTPE